MGSGLGDPKALGEALRSLRHARGMKQAELASAAGTRRATISDYERGMVSPSLESLDSLLTALQVDLHELSNALRLVPIQRRVFAGDLRPSDSEHAAFLCAENALVQWLGSMRERLLVEATTNGNE